MDKTPLGYVNKCELHIVADTPAGLIHATLEALYKINQEVVAAVLPSVVAELRLKAAKIDYALIWDFDPRINAIAGGPGAPPAGAAGPVETGETC